MKMEMPKYDRSTTFLSRRKWEKSLRIMRMCNNKIKYNNEVEADAYGRLYNYRHNENLPYRAYFCPHCIKWHLTTEPKRNQE